MKEGKRERESEIKANGGRSIADRGNHCDSFLDYHGEEVEWNLTTRTEILSVEKCLSA